MKKKVLIIFGGRSAEHEVSLRSGKNIFLATDKQKYQVNLIAISKQGSWYKFEDESVFNQTAITDKNLPKGAKPVSLVCLHGQPHLFDLESKATEKVDIAFPVLHGTFGEDGCIQGLFKMVNLPFVGCGVMACANGMDKEVMKRLLVEAKIPVAKWITTEAHDPKSFDELASALGLPFFIKPANAGSSVGVHKIKTRADFTDKIKDAFLYDHKVLAEEFIAGREIECSVMGLCHDPKASLPGEVIPSHEFYSYEAKYIDDNGAQIVIPAKLDSTTIAKVQQMAIATYKSLSCDGLTRVDFFLASNGHLYVNEINTLPGFTKISMYPKMWEASGLGPAQLVNDLIHLGFKKYEKEAALKTDFL